MMFHFYMKRRHIVQRFEKGVLFSVVFLMGGHKVALFTTISTWFALFAWNVTESTFCLVENVHFLVRKVRISDVRRQRKNVAFQQTHKSFAIFTDSRNRPK